MPPPAVPPPATRRAAASSASSRAGGCGLHPLVRAGRSTRWKSHRSGWMAPLGVGGAGRSPCRRFPPAVSSVSSRAGGCGLHWEVRFAPTGAGRTHHSVEIAPLGVDGTARGWGRRSIAVRWRVRFALGGAVCTHWCGQDAPLGGNRTARGRKRRSTGVPPPATRRPPCRRFFGVVARWRVRLALRGAAGTERCGLRPLVRAGRSTRWKSHHSGQEAPVGVDGTTRGRRRPPPTAHRPPPAAPSPATRRAAARRAAGRDRVWPSRLAPGGSPPGSGMTRRSGVARLGRGSPAAARTRARVPAGEA